ncbi:hypothetical protein ACHAWF_016912 [Thalassiosira exigua]
MTSATVSSAAPTKPVVRRRRRHDRHMSIDEMRRLMDVYGPIKCLRKRQPMKGNGEGCAAKDDSIKRKFYRWFPDLDKRFAESGEGGGRYEPKAGHDIEIRYRKEMREKNSLTLSKKRTKCRQERYGGKDEKKASTPKTDAAHASPAVLDAPTSFTPDVVPSLISFEAGDVSGMDFDHGLYESSDVAMEAEPVDSSFVAEEGIFDAVDKSFYGPSEQDSPSVSSASSSEAQGSNSSWESDLPSLEDMLSKSMEECYEEILGSDDSATMDDDFLFDMMAKV